MLRAEVWIALVVAAGAIALGAAGFHVYWAAGGSRGANVAVPLRADGSPAFSPGPLACLAVAGALVAFAGLLWLVPFGPASPGTTTALAIALGILVIRIVGDRRQTGFSKTNFSTAFSRADSQLFTPLVVVLAVGAGLSLFVL